MEAPSWQGTTYKGYDYETLGKSVDRMVLRITSYEKTSGSFPTAPVEPLEELYYALGEMAGKVDSGKLSVLMTTTGSSWTAGKKSGSMSGAEIETVLADKETVTYYSNRYACAYLSGSSADNKSLVVWYLNGQAAAERTQLLRCFNVNQVCLSDLRNLSPDFTLGLR